MARRAGMIRAGDLPADALLRRYQDHYTDCYMATADVDLPTLIAAFYTTPLFRAERMVLRLTGHPSTDADVKALAAGADQFAAWRVEARAVEQILLCDASGATRSWLMARDGQVAFGSAVVQDTWLVRALVPLHRLYSRALLSAALRRLRRQR